MKLVGDPEAIEALKGMHKKNAGFLKSLLEDARSTTDHATFFRDDSGQRYRLVLDPTSGELSVERWDRSSKLPDQ